MLCAGRKRRYTDVAPPDESSGGKVSGSDLYNLEAGQAVLTDNNDVQIYTDGKEKFQALLREMRGAKKVYSFSVLYYPK